VNPIGERVLWFVLGLVAGWLACRLLSRRPRRNEAPKRAAEAAAEVTSLAAPASAEIPPDPLPAGPSPSRMIDVGAARAAGFNMKHADDLTIIEGIGPKTDELLRANGIESFVQVAQLHVDDLLDILERGGPNFRLANPASWAQQALLAAENRWTELKRVQNEMLGGDANPAA
jgi:predicted flap endonuclease-1-like 5' DNA nuclease